MGISPLAGKPAPRNLLIDVEGLIRAYYATKPDVSDARELVSFGTSGHRGTVGGGERTFTEAHILAITQAIVDYRRQQKIDGPVFVGRIRMRCRHRRRRRRWRCWRQMGWRR